MCAAAMNSLLFEFGRYIAIDMEETHKDPLHGKTLEMILNELVEHYGWEELGARIHIRCFNLNPSIKSSLHFLRRTEWARKKWRLCICSG